MNIPERYVRLCLRVGRHLDGSVDAHVSIYADGRRLCRDFADRAPGNFTRLLTEQLTTTDLLA